MFNDNGTNCNERNKFKWFNIKTIITTTNDSRDITSTTHHDIKTASNTKKNAKRHTDNNPIDNTTANNSPTTSYNVNL